MIYCRFIIALILLTASAARADEAKPATPAAGDKCPVCGMFVAKYPDFLAQIVFKDGSRVFFDGVKDMMKYYLALPKYNPAKQGADIAAIFVTDYYSLSPIDGFKAYYVYGSNVYGPMGKELIPFKGESEAKEFLKDHGGRSLLRFNDLNDNLIKVIDQ
jgi:nitrous oxide reductase accessory protein NosL